MWNHWIVRSNTVERKRQMRSGIVTNGQTRNRRTNQRRLGTWGILLLTFPLWLSCGTPPDPPPPNFIIIYCDDLGYGDIGPFGSTKHKTPNLDRMAAEGRKLTSFYVTSGVCSPSRSSLMTSSYPRRVGIHKNPKGKSVLYPADSRGLHPDEITIAEVLKQRGYATGIVGKWHLGDQPEFLPTRQGFDFYFGIPYSNDMGADYFPEYNFPPLPLLRNEEVIESEPDQSLITRRYTEEAIGFITTHKEEPFFLYLPHTMPHVPIYASERFRGKSKNGEFGDAVEEIDWSTGKILGTLAELGIDNQTLVIFTSDNGGAQRFGASNDPLRGGKGSVLEGGMRVPCVMRWPGRIPPASSSDELAITMDLLPTFAHLSGASVPDDRVLDGRNIWPLMSGGEGARTPHDAFYYYQLGSLGAVRSGNWKLHFGRLTSKDGEIVWNPSTELYDLSQDIGESNNVAEENPEVVRRLRALADQARSDLGDDQSSQHAQGSRTRPPGSVDDPVALTRR